MRVRAGRLLSHDVWNACMKCTCVAMHRSIPFAVTSVHTNCLILSLSSHRSFILALLLAHWQEWCHDNFINTRSMATVVEVRKQLKDLCLRLGLPMASSKSGEDLRRCLLSGLFMNTAQHAGEGKYKTVSGACQSYNYVCM